MLDLYDSVSVNLHERDAEKEYTEVSFTAKGDGLAALLRLLSLVKYNGDVGHSHSIVVDGESVGGWDGDGADRVGEIFVDGEELTKVEQKELLQRLREFSGKGES